MRPEMPYLAAGAIAITGGAIKNHGWPANTLTSVIGTVALVIIASATSDTKIAPLVRAVGLLVLLSAFMAAVKAVITSKKGK